MQKLLRGPLSPWEKRGHSKMHLLVLEQAWLLHCFPSPLLKYLRKGRLPLADFHGMQLHVI